MRHCTWAAGRATGPVDHQARARRLERAADTKPWEHLYAAEELTGENPKNLVKPAQQKSPEPKVTPAGPWTAALWEATGDIWRDILDLPFIHGLGDGTLDEDLFGFYLDQDAQYLAQYSRALATLSARASSSQGQVQLGCGALRRRLLRNRFCTMNGSGAPRYSASRAVFGVVHLGSDNGVHELFTCYCRWRGLCGGRSCGASMLLAVP